MPAHTGDAVAGWLKSPNGIYSTFYLATDEMEMIKEDTWNDTVWNAPPDEHSEVARSSGITVPLCFYFGKVDVWVWNESRDRLIASRGRLTQDATELWKPLMIVDDGNVPHDFIVDHNRVIAEKASEMIIELFHKGLK